MGFCVRNNYSSPLLAFKCQGRPWNPPMTSGQEAASFADKYWNKVNTFESSFHRPLQLPQTQQEDWTALQFSTSWLVEELSGFTICPRSKELSRLPHFKSNERPWLCPRDALTSNFKEENINKAIVKLKIFKDYCSIWRRGEIFIILERSWFGKQVFKHSLKYDSEVQVFALNHIRRVSLTTTAALETQKFHLGSNELTHL